MRCKVTLMMRRDNFPLRKACMELPRQLRRFRAQMQRLQNKKLKQVRIEQLLV